MEWPGRGLRKCKTFPQDKKHRELMGERDIHQSLKWENLLSGKSQVPCIVMPNSWNLPMTTREPISDAKAREFLLPSSSWGSHRYWRSSYREEPWALDYIAYIGYSRAKNGSPLVWLVTFRWRVRCWVLIGSPFLGLTRISGAGQGFWLVRSWWGEVRGFPKALFPEPYKME